jgi:hypothetical protein
MARIYKLSENWLISAGIALLFLSVVMIPSNRALGAGFVTCNQTNCNNSCQLNSERLGCTTGNTDCTKQNCPSSCICRGCWPSKTSPCQCHCCGTIYNFCVMNNTQCPPSTCD